VGSIQLLLPRSIPGNVSFPNTRCILNTFSDIKISNLVYIGIFFAVELAFMLIASSFFAAADGNSNAALALQKAGGAFAFIAGMLGYYIVGNLMLQEATFFSFPMGDTSRFFKKKSEIVRKG